MTLGNVYVCGSMTSAQLLLQLLEGFWMSTSTNRFRLIHICIVPKFQCKCGAQQTRRESPLCKGTLCCLADLRRPLSQWPQAIFGCLKEPWTVYPQRALIAALSLVDDWLASILSMLRTKAVMNMLHMPLCGCSKPVASQPYRSGRTISART